MANRACTEGVLSHQEAASCARPALLGHGMGYERCDRTRAAFTEITPACFVGPLPLRICPFSASEGSAPERLWAPRLLFGVF